MGGWSRGVEMRVEMDGAVETMECGCWYTEIQRSTNLLHRGKKGFIVSCCNFDNATAGAVLLLQLLLTLLYHRYLFLSQILKGEGYKCIRHLRVHSEKEPN